MFMKLNSSLITANKFALGQVKILALVTTIVGLVAALGFSYLYTPEKEVASTKVSLLNCAEKRNVNKAYCQEKKVKNQQVWDRISNDKKTVESGGKVVPFSLHRDKGYRFDK